MLFCASHLGYDVAIPLHVEHSVACDCEKETTSYTKKCPNIENWASRAHVTCHLVASYSPVCSDLVRGRYSRSIRNNPACQTMSPSCGMVLVSFWAVNWRRQICLSATGHSSVRGRLL